MLELTKPKRSHIWSRDPNDFYIEPRWCSERLFAVEKFEGDVLDPACGSGRILLSAEAAGLSAHGSDIEERFEECPIVDFLNTPIARHAIIENIVSNPPFKHAEAFVRRALVLAEAKVAMLLPLTWMAGSKRAAWLETTPLLNVLVLTPRPSMPPGAVIAAGEDPGGGTKDFAWFIWQCGYEGRPHLGWLRRDA